VLLAAVLLAAVLLAAVLLAAVLLAAVLLAAAVLAAAAPVAAARQAPARVPEGLLGVLPAPVRAAARKVVPEAVSRMRRRFAAAPLPMRPSFPPVR